MSDDRRRRPVLIVLAVLAIAVALGAPFFSGPSSEDPPGPSAPAPEGTPGPAPVEAIECPAATRARVGPLEVGETIGPEWRIDAIQCVQDDPCARVELSHAASALTIRACPHVEGGPVPPVTHGDTDLFWDSPRTPEAAVDEPVIRAILDAIVLRLGPAAAP